MSDEDNRGDREQQEENLQLMKLEDSEAGKEQEAPYMERFYGKTVEEAEAIVAEPEEDEEPEQPEVREQAAVPAIPDEEAGAGTEDEQADPNQMTDAELNATIEEICRSKAQEFRMLGYEHVTGLEIWECVSDKYHKSGTPPLHRIVNDILSLKVTQFMNWMTISMYKNSK